MLAKWCETAYFDGIKELYESRSCKCKFFFWIFTLIVMFGFACYFVTQIVINYFVSPTSTAISTVPFVSQKLPEILICFNGGLNASALLAENFSTDLIYVVSGSLPFGTIKLKDPVNAKRELDNYLHQNNLNMAQFYQKFAYSCEDMVEIVYKAGTDKDQSIRCEDVTKVVSSIYGICLLYKENGVQHWSGLSGGVRFYLKQPPNSVVEKFPEISLKLDKSLSYAISVERSFLVQTERFVLAPINAKTEISLDTMYFRRLPEGETHCNESSIDNHSNICFGRCYAEAMYNNCGCVPCKYKDTVDSSFKICTPFEEYSCWTFLAESIACEQTCKPKCEEWIFDNNLSYSPFESPSESPTTSVWIGYSTKQYIQVVESYAFTIEDAIANVGGLIGLWLGCSIVSFVQAAYYIVLTINDKIEDRRKVFAEVNEFDFRRETRSSIIY